MDIWRQRDHGQGKSRQGCSGTTGALPLGPHSFIPESSAPLPKPSCSLTRSRATPGSHQDLLHPPTCFLFSLIGLCLPQTSSTCVLLIAINPRGSLLYTLHPLGALYTLPELRFYPLRHPPSPVPTQSKVQGASQTSTTSTWLCAPHRAHPETAAEAPEPP